MTVHSLTRRQFGFIGLSGGIVIGAMAMATIDRTSFLALIEAQTALLPVASSNGAVIQHAGDPLPAWVNTSMPTNIELPHTNARSTYIDGDNSHPHSKL